MVLLVIIDRVSTTVAMFAHNAAAILQVILVQSLSCVLYICTVISMCVGVAW